MKENKPAKCESGDNPEGFVPYKLRYGIFNKKNSPYKYCFKLK